MNKLLVLALATPFFLGGCGKGETKDSDGFTAQEAKARAITKGDYTLGSANFQGTDASGAQLQTQTLQVTGTGYHWNIDALGANKYKVTATGAVQFLLNRQQIASLNCTGAQDVFSFEVSSNNAIKNLKQIQTGCASGVSEFAAYQLSVETIDKKTFAFTTVGTSNGSSFVLTYTFSK